MATGALALLLAGCTAAHHRKAADKEVYRIIQQVEGQVFGHTNAFTIDTGYSGRKPQEILPDELINDRLQTNRRLLRIEDALDLAVRNSRTYQAEKERLYLTALTLTGQRYEFRPQFLAGASAGLDRASDGEKSGSVDSRIGVSQLLKTGGRLGANLANDILRYYTGDPRRSVISTISVNLAQPLLRGFGRNNSAVESLTQAERNVVYAVRDYSFFQDDFALDIVTDYFALVAQKDTIRNRYANYLGRVTSRRRLEARVDRDAPSAVDQARQAELTAKNTYINSAIGYRTSLDAFKIKLGLPLGESFTLDDDVLKEIRDKGLVPVPLDPVASYRLAVESQVQILNAIDRFEDSKRKIRLAADRFKPNLTLLADASLNSEGPTDYTTFDPDKVRAGVGLQLDLPIDTLPDRNNYRATLVSFESQLRSLTLTLDTLRDSIERGLHTLRQRQQTYEIQQNALKLADRRVVGSTLGLQASRNEVRDLLEAQDAQIAAQNAVTAALVDYQNARLQLMLNIGLLDAKSPRFWLKDQLAGLESRLAPAESGPPRTEAAAQDVPPPDFFFDQ